MPVTSSTTDPENLTLTLVADFPVSQQRLWDAFTTREQLDRFWGPPGWPATFEEVDVVPGATVRYAMVGPRSEKARGQWQFLTVEAPNRFEVRDDFVNEDGTVSNAELSSRQIFEFSTTDSGSRVIATTQVASAEALEQLVQMGMVEGSELAFNQLDVVLQDLRDYAAGKGTQVETLTNTSIRITRLINGPRDVVWRALHEKKALEQWLLGPDGWQLTVQGPDVQRAGDTYRYEWEPEPGTEGDPFAFEGEVLQSDEPRRAVTTESMVGMDTPPSVNDLSLHEEGGVTLLTLVIEYSSKELRDMVLATGMVDGMERSYQRLDDLVTVPA